MVKKYAVVGYWYDSDQVYTEFVEAEDGYAALADIAESECRQDNTGVLLLAAIGLQDSSVTVPGDGKCEARTAEQIIEQIEAGQWPPRS